MTWTEFFIVFISCVISMLACRTIPLLLLKGKNLPDKVSEALGYIPPAVFAALVANDLFSPHMFDAGLWPAAAPLLASLLVVIVGLKTKSLIWCVIVGVGAYAALLMIT